MKDNILTVNKANSIFCDWGQKNELLDVEPFIIT